MRIDTTSTTSARTGIRCLGSRDSFNMFRGAGPRVSSSHPEFFSAHLPVEVSIDRVLHSLTPTNCPTPSPRTVRSIQQSIETLQQIGPATAMWTALPVHHQANGTTLGQRVQVASTKVAHTLKKCPTAIVFAVTLGQKVDTLIEETQEKSVHKGMVLDRAASIAAEQTVETLHRQVKSWCAPHMDATHRYSPGYCDWPLDDQRRITSLLPLHACGIRVETTSLLHPRKSVTGVIGIGPRGIVEQHGNACGRCGQRNCTFRRKGTI